MANVSLFDVASFAPYLDRQLLILLLQHVKDSSSSSKKDALQVCYDMLKGTGRYDLAQELANEMKAAGLKVQDLQAIQNHQKKLLERIQQLIDETSNITDVIRAAQAEEFRVHDRSFNANMVRERCEVTNEDMDKLYELGKLQYEAGKFEEALQTLEDYRRVCMNSSLFLVTMWGKFAARIMSGTVSEAMDDLNRLKDAVESASLASASHTLQQRTWFLHWSIFALFQVEGGLDRLFEIFMSPSYMNAIESSCPWILRYIVAASILSGKNFKEVAKYTAQERYHYNDPLCRVFESIFLNVDLDEVAVRMNEVEDMLVQDYFLAPHQESILLGLRQHIFSTVSSIYTQISLTQFEYYLGVPDTFDWGLLIRDSSSVTITDGIVTFSQGAPARRSLLEKMDKLSHRTDNTLALLFKKN